MINLFSLIDAQMARRRPFFANSHGRPHVDGRPVNFFMTTGEINHYTVAEALLGSLPKADWLLADRDYHAD